MLPIRLGMANATGRRTCIVYTLTRKGRVEIDELPDGGMPTDSTCPCS